VFYIRTGGVIMQITDVRIRKIDTAGKLRAVASITFDDEFVVHDIKVIEGNESLFVAMPSVKNARNEFKDVAHPIKTELREKISKAVLEKFAEEGE
jgi:stage V sporulation protein G